MNGYYDEQEYIRLKEEAEKKEKIRNRNRLKRFDDVFKMLLVIISITVSVGYNNFSGIKLWNTFFFLFFALAFWIFGHVVGDFNSYPEGEPFIKLMAWSTAMLTATIVFYKFSFQVSILDFSGMAICGVIAFVLTLLAYIWLRNLLSRFHRRNLLPFILTVYYAVVYWVSQGWYLL